MAGTFITMNKVRPGAYVNFKAVPKPSFILGERGVVTMPIVLPWGPSDDVIEILSSDMVDGKIFEKVGLNAQDDGAKTLREALKNAYKVLAYRINSNGEKARAEIVTGVTATAKYFGTTGNKISVSIVAEASGYSISTYVDANLVDKQVIDIVSDFKENKWIELSGTGELEEVLGVALEDGSDGATVDSDYTKYTNLMKMKTWNVMAIPSVSTTLPPIIAVYIEHLRDEVGKKVQAVVLNYNAADYEGIISVEQGYMIGEERVEPHEYVAYRAGVAAAAQVNQSNTYHRIRGATGIIGQLNNEDTIKALQEGRDVLSVTQSGDVVIERDINTLHTFDGDKSRDFSKNRVIRVLDDIATEAATRFESKYIGKVTNNASGRSIYKGELVGLLASLNEMEAIQEFKGADDISVDAGPEIDSIIVGISVKPADAMEIAYITCTIS